MDINIKLTEKDMDKNLTPDDITLGASDLSHLRNIMEARKILNSVWDRYNKAICAKLNNESTKNITITNRAWLAIDEAMILQEFGEDGLAKVKVKPIEQHYVSKL